MLKYSAAELIRQLEREGLGFRSFSLVHEGDYTVEDADWNYKDVPHLHHIHQLVEAHPAAVDDKFIATLNLQEVLGLRIPLTVFNYESGTNEQTYFTSFVFFVLVICTRYEQLAELRCRVTTTYSFGAPPWMLFLFPLAKWALSRNYADLMSGDIPMRTRRGQLRAWGARFAKPGPTHSFHQTMDIAKKNVVFPSEVARERSQTFTPTLTEASVELPAGPGERFLGRSDEFGIKVVATPEEVLGFPRACRHEGACLDDGTLANGQLSCPWHGRRILPLFKLKRSGSPSEAHFRQAEQNYRVSLTGGTRLAISLAGKST